MLQKEKKNKTHQYILKAENTFPVPQLQCFEQEKGSKLYTFKI